MFLFQALLTQVSLQSLRSFALCWLFANSDYYDRSDALPPLQPQLVQPISGPVVGPPTFAV
jgi:hypothetical protein